MSDWIPNVNKPAEPLNVGAKAGDRDGVYRGTYTRTDHPVYPWRKDGSFIVRTWSGMDDPHPITEGLSK